MCRISFRLKQKLPPRDLKRKNLHYMIHGMGANALQIY